MVEPDILILELVKIVQQVTWWLNRLILKKDGRLKENMIRRFARTVVANFSKRMEETGDSQDAQTFPNVATPVQ